MPPIAQKYQVTAMLTFVVIRETGVVDMLRGADPRGLSAMVAKHASAPPVPAGPPLPAEAEKAKVEGNAAFAKGEYQSAIESYTRAIDIAPNSAVLYGNRALAYIKLIKSGVPCKEERQMLRPKLASDAHKAMTLDERWAKGWVRMAEALVLACDEEGIEGVKEEKQTEVRRASLEGAQSALENAIGLGEGKVKAGELLQAANTIFVELNEGFRTDCRGPKIAGGSSGATEGTIAIAVVVKVTQCSWTHSCNCHERRMHILIEGAVPHFVVVVFISKVSCRFVAENPIASWASNDRSGRLTCKPTSPRMPFPAFTHGDDLLLLSTMDTLFWLWFSTPLCFSCTVI